MISDERPLTNLHGPFARSLRAVIGERAGFWPARLFSADVTSFLLLVVPPLVAVGAGALRDRRRPDTRRTHVDDPQLLYVYPYVLPMIFALMAEPLTLLLTALGLLRYLCGWARDSDQSFVTGSVAALAALHVRMHAAFAVLALLLLLLPRRDLARQRRTRALAPLPLRRPLVLLRRGPTAGRGAFLAVKLELGHTPADAKFYLVWLGYMFRLQGLPRNPPSATAGRYLLLSVWHFRFLALASVRMAKEPW